MRSRSILIAISYLILLHSFHSANWAVGQADWTEVELPAPSDPVAPMTGIVLWDSHEQVDTDAIKLEYSYVGYDEVVRQQGVYDWRVVDQKLSAIASRGHQAILRFYFVYVGRPTTVPQYIKTLPDYREMTAKSEGQTTSFADWRHPELQRFLLDFYSRLAKRYDSDRRLAFLQTGFGLWAEYHIYDGPFQLGRTFPDKALQLRFARHMDASFRQTPWMISVDAADDERAPFARADELRTLGFGLFDDSFLCKQHSEYNAVNWQALGENRWQTAPAGGEFNYYTRRDQRMALAPNGPHGVSFTTAAAQFHITFMIGNDQPEYQSLADIRKASAACGYRFHLEQLETNGRQTRGVITNRGVAPIYFPAFPAIGNVLAEQSLQGLLPGARLSSHIPAVAAAESFHIACDRLVPGQSIPVFSGEQ